MKPDSPMTPPLSPTLLAGMALRPLPLAPLRPILALVMAAVVKRHPRMFDPLRDFGDPVFVIDPVDLPFVFVLRPAAQPVGLRAERTAEGIAATATIRGPMPVLLDLLEGRIDGDAMFFSRELTISGDTEAVLALRNSVDGAGVELVPELLSFLGPLAIPAGKAVDLAARVARRFDDDLQLLTDALTGPGLRRVEAQAARIRALEERIAKLEKRAKGKVSPT